MANLKGGHSQSYKTLHKTFVSTLFGDVRLELAVGQQNVLAIDRQGIKGTTPIGQVRESDSPLIKACRDSNGAAFDKFCDELDKVSA